MGKELLTQGHAVVGALSVKHGLALHELVQTFDHAEFTDAGAAIGHVHFTNAIPAGALVLGGRVVVNAGFTGDTSAVMTVGDGSVVDRYNTSTVNVFATAASGIDLGLPGGVRYHDAAKTPIVTVTSAADFTSVVAGSLTVSLFYITPSEDLAGA